MSRGRELRVLGDMLERHRPGFGRIGQLLERSTRIMELDTQEYIDAYITVDNTDRPVYVSQDTTRAIIADCWARVEDALVEANAAFNAVAVEPHSRALTLLSALKTAAKHADVIYVLTPMPEDDEAA
jgi:hypothetical protein